MTAYWRASHLVVLWANDIMAKLTHQAYNTQITNTYRMILMISSAQVIDMSALLLTTVFFSTTLSQQWELTIELTQLLFPGHGLNSFTVVSFPLLSLNSCFYFDSFLEKYSCLIRNSSCKPYGWRSSRLTRLPVTRWLAKYCCRWLIYHSLKTTHIELILDRVLR